MTTQFDDRRRSEEARFAHNEELRFRAVMRRNKLLAEWAAGLMGIEDETGRQAYANEVVAADFTEVGADDVLRKVAGDLKAKGLAISDETIKLKMEEFLATAKEQILGESKE